MARTRGRSAAAGYDSVSLRLARIESAQFAEIRVTGPGAFEVVAFGRALRLETCFRHAPWCCRGYGILCGFSTQCQLRAFFRLGRFRTRYLIAMLAVLRLQLVALAVDTAQVFALAPGTLGRACCFGRWYRVGHVDLFSARARCVAVCDAAATFAFINGPRRGRCQGENTQQQEAYIHVFIGSEDFAGIHQVQRIERLFNGAHQLHFDGGFVAQDFVTFESTDAVFGRD